MNDYTGKRLFGSWYIPDFNRPLGKGSFGTVYELCSYNSIIDPTAVKIISIPNSRQEYRSLLGAVGADERGVNAKLTQAKERLLNEIAITLKVSGYSNCVSCMAYDVVPHEDCFGWDVLIQMEKLETLDAYYRRKGTITNFDIVMLGMDMCSALDICAANSIAHRDIKPANIMVKEAGDRVDYKLTDFGVAGILRGSGTMTITGTIEYMAPELFRGEGDARVDIYSLGIVLYELLNANRLPFLPDYPAAYTDNDVGLARAKRLKGERPPEPLYAAGTELGKTIVKACEYRPEDRFKNAKEMYGALKEALSKGEKRAIFSVPAVGPYLPTQREERKRRAAENEDTKPAGRAQGRHTARGSIRSDKALTDNVAKAQNAAAKRQTGRHEKLYTEPKQATAKSAAKQAEKRTGRRKTLWIAVPAALCVIAISIVGVLAARQSGWIGAAREKETQTEAVPVTSSAAEEIAAVEIPDGLKYTIENGSAIILGYTGSAEEIELPSEINGARVSTIDFGAFYNCTALTSITIPDSVTTIGEYAFSDCDSLTSVTIPSSVTTIGDSAFDGCTNLTSVTIPESITTINGSVFYGCTSLTSITIPDSVTSIGNEAFRGCTSLTSMMILEGVTTIGEAAFYDCTSLTSVTIPDSVTTIGSHAFSGCRALTTVTIPDSVTSIGEDAFDEATVIRYDYSSSYHATVAAGNCNTFGLREDGTVVTAGYTGEGQCEVSDWADIVAVAAGYYHTVGLKEDGTVVAVSRLSDSTCDVSDWTDIVAIAAGRCETVGVKADGSVVATDYNFSGLGEVSDWTDIVAVAAGGYHTIGLKSDGTVIATGWNNYGQCNVSDWADIVAVAAGDYYTVGLRADGSVVATGYTSFGQCDVSDWTDIVAVAAGWNHTVGLKSDGSVVAVGSNSNGQCEASDWTDIVAVAAGRCNTVGIKADGTIVVAGDNEYGQCDVSDWTDIRVPGT